MSDSNTQPSYPVVFAACKRGKDMTTSGQVCNGRRASRISDPGSQVVTLRCLTCNHAWTVPVGGSINL